MADKVLKATHGSLGHPLCIGDVKIPCYVLEDETRVLTQRGLQISVGMSKSGARGGAHRMARFVDSLAENTQKKPFLKNFTLKAAKLLLNWCARQFTL